MRFGVLTDDEKTTYYDGAYELHPSGVLAINEQDQELLLLAPGRWIEVHELLDPPPGGVGDTVEELRARRQARLTAFEDDELEAGPPMPVTP